MSGLPAISVILPVFNGARYVSEAIRSITNQSFRDFELIIIDDGSTDNSLKIIELIIAGDDRCRVLSRENKGIVFSCNQALAMARGDYVFRMDADDIAMPHRFERQVSYLRLNPNCVALGTGALLIDPDGLPLTKYSTVFDHEGIDSAHLNGITLIVHPTVAMQRQAAIGVGGYRQEYEWAEDIDLFLRLAEIGRLANLPDILLEYRQHLGSVGHAKRAKQLEAQFAATVDARRRRGLPQLQIQRDSGGGMAVADVHRKWAWWALSEGNIRTARKHAFRALRLDPMNPDNIRLVGCAVRGH